MSESQKPLHGPAIPAVNLSKPGEVQRVISQAMQKQTPMPRLTTLSQPAAPANPPASAKRD